MWGAFWPVMAIASLPAVLLVAIAAILATALVDRLNLDIRRTENLIHSEQAYVYAQGAEIVAIAALVEDRKNSKHDSLDEIWAEQSPPFPVEGGAVIGQLFDLQACFNINNLSATLNAANINEDRARFGRLLSALELSPEIGNSVIDWLDDDAQTTSPGGAEDDWYIGLTPAYRAANAPVSSISELRMIKGLEPVDGDLPYEKLVPASAKIPPYVCALPIATTINVNTASKEVLKSLATEISDDDADKIIERRQGGPEPDSGTPQPFETLENFKSFMQTELKKTNFVTSGMNVSSNYFLLDATAQIGNSRTHLYSIIQRNDNGSCRVIARSQGVW